jgi:hypothetical protein
MSAIATGTTTVISTKALPDEHRASRANILSCDFI